MLGQTFIANKFMSGSFSAPSQANANTSPFVIRKVICLKDKVLQRLKHIRGTMEHDQVTDRYPCSEIRSSWHLDLLPNSILASCNVGTLTRMRPVRQTSTATVASGLWLSYKVIREPHVSFVIWNESYHGIKAAMDSFFWYIKQFKIGMFLNVSPQ